MHSNIDKLFCYFIFILIYFIRGKSNGVDTQRKQKLFMHDA